RHRGSLEQVGMDPFTVAADLCEKGSGHRLWDLFASAQVPVPSPGDVPPGWVPTGPPEGIGTGYRVVRLAPGTDAAGRPGQAVAAWAVRQGRAGWRVAGLGGRPALPSWPPEGRPQDATAGTGWPGPNRSSSFPDG